MASFTNSEGLNMVPLGIMALTQYWLWYILIIWLFFYVIWSWKCLTHLFYLLFHYLRIGFPLNLRWGLLVEYKVVGARWIVWSAMMFSFLRFGFSNWNWWLFCFIIRLRPSPILIPIFSLEMLLLLPVLVVQSLMIVNHLIKDIRIQFCYQ